MEKKSILQKISSKSVFDNIFEFLKDSNFKLKLFVYSKAIQKQYELKLVDYEKSFIDKFGIDLNNYLFSENNKFVRKFDKTILTSILTEDLSLFKLDINILNKIIIDFFNQKYEDQYKNLKSGDEVKDLVEEEVPIEIYSPFLDILSTTDVFESIFTIPISTYIIEKFDLGNDYISVFDKLNRVKSKYSSLTIYYEDSYDILDFKEFKINFNQIKRISFIPNSYHVTGDYKYFLKTLFSFFSGFEKNLVNLKLKWTENEIDSKLIAKINNFKSLKLLNLTGFKLTNNFVLKLNNLKKLTLDTCENISLTQDTCLNLIKLKIINSSINKSESLLQVPNIEECELTYIDNSNLKYYSIFDISTFKKLKHFVGDPCDFSFVESNDLVYVKLISYSEVSLDIKKKVYKKLALLKYLKEIVIEFGKIEDEEIWKIIGKNYSLKKMKINWVKKNSDLVIYNLQDKFSNLTSLEINSPKYEDSRKIVLTITENEYCKINKLYLNAGLYNNIKLYCQPFENLVDIDLTLNNQIINLKDAIPIFNKKCKVIFNSLNIFRFKTINNHVINMDILENLYNNIYFMPNLSNLMIDLRIRKRIEKDFYESFFKKCLNLNLRRIYFSIKGIPYPKEESYTKEELEKICPGKNFSKFKELFIRKL